MCWCNFKLNEEGGAYQVAPPLKTANGVLFFFNHSSASFKHLKYSIQETFLIHFMVCVDLHIWSTTVSLGQSRLWVCVQFVTIMWNQIYLIQWTVSELFISNIVQIFECRSCLYAECMSVHNAVFPSTLAVDSVGDCTWTLHTSTSKLFCGSPPHY